MEATRELEVRSNEDNLELYSENYPFRLSLRIRNFESESEFKKFVKNIERLVRGSLEYKLWKDYIKDILQVNSCMITNERMDECSVEIHHHIPSLFAIVKAFVNKKIEDEDEFSTFDVATEVIELHYQNRVGYVAIVRSLHEKFHNGYLDIPVSSVMGDYNNFLETYSQYLDQNDMDAINQKLSISSGNCGWTRGLYPGSGESD